MTGTVLVMAKAPVAGRVKTRLGRTVGDAVAARLALLSLLDTVAACSATFGAGRCRLALDGDLSDVADADSLRSALDGWTVIAQRGDGLAERIVAAHLDVFDGRPLVQVGMDTPQLAPADLHRLVATTAPRQVALGPAADGGWWGIAHRDPACLEHLVDVPMSHPATGALTRHAVERTGFHVVLGDLHRDVDTHADAVAVATAAPGSLFAAGVREHLTAEVLA